MSFDTSRPKQNVQNFTDRILKMYFQKEKSGMKFAPESTIDNEAT